MKREYRVIAKLKKGFTRAVMVRMKLRHKSTSFSKEVTRSDRIKIMSSKKSTSIVWLSVAELCTRKIIHNIQMVGWNKYSNFSVQLDCEKALRRPRAYDFNEISTPKKRLIKNVSQTKVFSSFSGSTSSWGTSGPSAACTSASSRQYLKRGMKKRQKIDTKVIGISIQNLFWIRIEAFRHGPWWSLAS